MYRSWILIIIWTLVFIIQFNSGKEKCGEKNCKIANNISKDKKEKCSKHPNHSLCKQGTSQLRQRFPDALTTSKELNETCWPACRSGDINDVRETPNLCIPPGCEQLMQYGENEARTFMSLPFSGEQPGQGRKKRRLQFNSDLNFNKLFRWANLGGKQCCRTMRKTIPIQWPLSYGKNLQFTAHPIFCPLSGGYQWIDLVRCDRRRCRTKCVKEHTYRVYLVTTIVPHPYWGHCLDLWIPAWFLKIRVDTHCVCVQHRQRKLPRVN